MTGRLAAEIKQTKPFSSLAEEALLNIHRTASLLALLVADTLKPYGLTETQYNILRILRGAGVEGLPCQEIGARMITREPDLTRLLDRLEKRGLVGRDRSAEDRRIVLNRITARGHMTLADIEPEARKLPKRILSHLNDRELRELITLLENVRHPG
jgi:MarR family transcriptional regulator, organic hydroperoxide resistance regulator